MSKEVVKMKQGMSYSCKEKTIILNVFKYFRKVCPDKSLTEIVKRTAKATGCSEKSIFQFRKEESSPEGFKEPTKRKVRKNVNINSRLFKYDDSVRESIKFIIYDLKYRNIAPSLNTILKNIKSNGKLPKFSLMTLRRLLFDMGFTYEKEKSSNKSILVEKKHANTDSKEHVRDQLSKHVPSEKTLETENAFQTLIKTEIKTDPQNIVPFHEATPQNHIYLPSTSNRQISMHHLPHHDSHVIKSLPVGLQHTMLLNHRMIHPYQPIHPHNEFIQH